ncbi:hypothetical protein Nepgr_031567 [Nepenthes gracilis]|uniref:Protein AATF n=1 Tax=Nepenthes gracilis TaxID=150966 RepID=A0AAD3TIE6_NEPGR|nr:hypothetical protein Nepgr_031567 [Nepenthes gracilis]
MTALSENQVVKIQERERRRERRGAREEERETLPTVTRRSPRSAIPVIHCFYRRQFQDSEMVSFARRLKRVSDDVNELDYEMPIVAGENENDDVAENHHSTSDDYDHDNEVEEEDTEDDQGKIWVKDGEQRAHDDEPNNGHKDAEMEELEKEYTDLRNMEQNLIQNLKRHKGEDLLKGQAVKNQKALWDKFLEIRFLLQKAFTNSNRLPQEPFRSSFCELDERVSPAYSDLIASSKKAINSLLKLQEALLENNPLITQGTEGNSEASFNDSKTSNNLEVDGEDEWWQITNMHSRITPFRNKSVDKWQRKTEVSTGAAAKRGKLLAFNQNISEQVAIYMRDPSKMIKSMQMRKETVGVFGKVAELGGNTKERTNADGDPELLDDSEFYQQLLKEFFETIDPSSSETAFYALKKLQTKKRKVVDRRASKSRKIRYNVHEKIVNFMAPQPMDLPPMAPKLFESLFGLKTQKSASAL